MTSMSRTSLPYSAPLSRAKLSARKPTRFDLVPNADERGQIAGALDLLDLPVARLKGEIRPVGQSDFALEAELTAEVVQACVVSLAPVPARIAETVQQIATATSEQARGSEQILRAAERMKNITKHVERSSQEQTRGSKQITRSIESISEMVSHLHAAQREQTKGGDQILQAVESLREIVRSQETRIGELNRMLEAMTRLAEFLRSVAKISPSTATRIGSQPPLLDDDEAA